MLKRSPEINGRRLGDTDPRMATGEYSYMTGDDGLHTMSSKKYIIPHANRAASTIGGRVCVYSPAGRVVYVAECPPEAQREWSAEDWLYGGEAEIIAAFGITPETTNDRLAEIAAEIERDAELDNVRLGDVVRYLHRLRGES